MAQLTNKKGGRLRCELHCHSEYSHDGVLSVEQIIQVCKKKDINCVALTDHNEINGALELSKKAPKWLRVIVAEEIATKEGDVIGLFIKRKIAKKQSLNKTITEIHQQGGLALLPHPADRLRKEAVGLESAQRVAQYLDAVEIFNSRNVFNKDNQLAEEFAEKFNLTGFVGSDAHFAGEYGASVVEMDNFSDPKDFSNKLGQAKLVKKKSSVLYHLGTKWKKINNKK